MPNPSTLNSPAPNRSTPWPALERLPSLHAIASVWRNLLGDHFETFHAAFLQKLLDPVKGVFCEQCYCTHEVIIYGPEAHARARAAIGHCPDAHLSTINFPTLN